MSLALFLINGLVLGSTYAVLAVGFALVFSVARLLNFSHTGLYMLSAFVMYLFISTLGLTLPLAILVAVFSPPILAVIFYKLLIERIKEYEFPVIILTFSLVLLIQEGFLIAFQANLLGIEPYIPGFTEIFGASVSNQHLFALIIGGIILLGVWWLLSRTWLGNAIKAVSQDTETANLMGMDVSFIQMITVGISALLAGLAAILVAPLFSIEPHMWFHPLIIVLAAVVLGGLGSLKGAVVGAFFLAFIEVAVISFIPQGSFLREAISLLAMVIVLTFKPEGLFGVVFEEERL